MKLYCEHVINMNADEFWAAMHRTDLEDAMMKGIGHRDHKEIEFKDGPSESYRKVHVSPSVPESYQVLLGKVAKNASVDFIEEQWKSKKEKVVRWTSTTAFAADKTKMAGTVTVVPIDESRCKRIMDGEVSVKMFGIGLMIEKAIVNSVVESYGRSAEAANEYASRQR